jgi:DNA-binding SARP family transcriptional activator
MIDQLNLRPQTVVVGQPLRIYLLGPVWIEWEGETLHVLRRQARALLYRLAVHMQPVPREELCFACWPDVPEAVAHRYLSHLLSHVRDALPVLDVVRSNNELVELDTHKVWSDAAAFRAGCAVLDTKHEAALQEAIGLYRGPFLSGFSLPGKPEFELWVAQQRSTFERLYLDALSTMMTAEANRADWSKATVYAREYLRVDELAEEVYRRLMVLYIMQGDRPAALQQYQRCVELLKRELGVPPLPETRAIYEAIMAGV